MVRKLTIKNWCTLYLCVFPNPQINSGISATFHTQSKLDGLLMYSYISKSARVKSIKSTKKINYKKPCKNTGKIVNEYFYPHNEVSYNMKIRVL